MSKLNYEKVFKTLVEETKEYLVDNNLKAMILGISGGIDSTVVAAICDEVNKQTGIPLIGRSLPIKNKDDEFNISKLVGEAFCNDFKTIPLDYIYCNFLNGLQMEYKDKFELFDKYEDIEQELFFQNSIANGNIQARLRMTYLYNLASINKGIVISTDNQTEYQLGFWTLHGDVGDFNPLFGLWKSEVYDLAKWIITNIQNQTTSHLDDNFTKKRIAINESIKLTPTDGLGITNSDLDQIKAKNYLEVDMIFKDYFNTYYDLLNGVDLNTLDYSSKKYLIDDYLDNNRLVNVSQSTIKNVLYRHLNSDFKRKNLPICIKRNHYEPFS